MGPTYYIQLLIAGISNGAMYAVIAVGWALIFSILKFSNFAHGGTMVCAAYAGMFLSKALQQRESGLIQHNGVYRNCYADRTAPGALMCILLHCHC